MNEVCLVRTVRFSAGHHYGRSDWSAEENRDAFGAGLRPHGHNWALTVTVRGPLDPETGFVVDLAALDEILDGEVVGRFDQRDLNQEIAPVREGTMQPSTESLARWFLERLAPLVEELPGKGRLVRLRLAESEVLAAEVEAG